MNTDSPAFWLGRERLQPRIFPSSREFVWLKRTAEMGVCNRDRGQGWSLLNRAIQLPGRGAAIVGKREVIAQAAPDRQFSDKW